MQSLETTTSVGFEELVEVRWQDASRAPIESRRIASLQIFVDDAPPQLSLQLHPLVEVLDSAAHQDCHRLDRLGHAESLEQNPLGVVELYVEFFGDRGICLELRAQMHRAESDVARFVLHAAPEDFLIDAAWRQELALAEHREHEALAEQLQAASLRGETRAVEDSLQRELAEHARLAESAAVGERALAEHVHV